MRGLDSSNIMEVKSMVNRGSGGSQIRRFIDTHIERQVYEQKNIDLIEWLRNHNYGDTADHLADYVNE